MFSPNQNYYCLSCQSKKKKKKKKKCLILPTKPHHKWEQLAYYTIHHNTWNVNVQYNAGMCTEMVQY